MERRPKILAFSGSLRAASTNNKILKIAVQGAEESGAEVTCIDLADYPMPLYNQEIEDVEGLPENALKIKGLIKEHDGLLIASPEYNSSISGVVKNVIDWVTRKAAPDEVHLSTFNGKIAALMATSPGKLGGLRGLVHLRSILENIYVLVLPETKTIPENSNAFMEDGMLKEPAQNDALKKLGKNLADMIRRIKR